MIGLMKQTMKPKKCLKQKIDEACEIAEDLQKEVKLVLKNAKDEASNERRKTKRLDERETS
jgi:hypothetical protein